MLLKQFVTAVRKRTTLLLSEPASRLVSEFCAISIVSASETQRNTSDLSARRTDSTPETPSIKLFVCLCVCVFFLPVSALSFPTVGSPELHSEARPRSAMNGSLAEGPAKTFSLLCRIKARGLTVTAPRRFVGALTPKNALYTLWKAFIPSPSSTSRRPVAATARADRWRRRAAEPTSFARFSRAKWSAFFDRSLSFLFIFLNGNYDNFGVCIWTI